MKKFILTALFCLVGGSLMAANYVGISLGTNDMRTTNSEYAQPKIGYKTNVSFGHMFSNGFRAEGVFTYSENAAKKGYSEQPDGSHLIKSYKHYHYWSGMANVLMDLYDLKFQSFTPYLGIGMGYCEATFKHKIKSPDISQSLKEREGRFAYQGIAGVKVNLDEIYSTAFEYNYLTGRAHAKDHSFNLYLHRAF